MKLFGPSFGNKNDGNSSRNRNSAFLGLEDKLEHLAFKPFQQFVLLWLGAKGFRHIQSLGRHYRRGRRSIGGADFTAQMPGTRVRVAIQVRHWSSPIQRRVVDELWGFMLRRHIPTGLIVTNSTFSKRSMIAAGEFAGRPIQMISRADLANSMVSLGLGVKDTVDGLELDESVFRSLNSLQLASAYRGDNLDGLRKSQRRISPSKEPARPEATPRFTRASVLVWALGLFLLAVIWLTRYGGRP